MRAVISGFEELGAELINLGLQARPQPALLLASTLCAPAAFPDLAVSYAKQTVPKSA